MFISIYNRANTLIYSGNCEVKQKFRVMGEETSTITIVSESVISFNYGDYVDVRGDRFYLHTNPKKSDSGTYLIYTLSFESVKYKLFGIIMQSFGRAKFDITTDLEGWCKLIIDNANRTDSGWSYIINEPLVGFKTLVVEGETCLSAVNRIFSEFKKEFRFVGKQLVVGRVGADLSNVLKVGRYQGAYQVTEEQDGTASPVTRLYVYGSDRNLPVKYNNTDGTTPTDRLTIKAVNGGLAYIEDAAKIALYGVIEGSYINEDIYPHRTGTISAIDAASIQNFTDTSIDFDVNAQLLPGIAAKVTFVSGDLSGYTFDVVSYNATTKQVRIAVGNDGSGKELPNTVFKPKVGDKYVFTDIAMPQSYITAGENDLKSDGLKEYARVSGWQRNFKLTAIDPTYQQDLNFYPDPGDKFGITSEGIVQQVRIVEYGINLTTEVPIYDGVQLADKVEPSLAQQSANSEKETATGIYMANKTANNAQTSATGAAISATAANEAASAANSAASSAKTAANAANQSIVDISSDDKVTAGEKQSLKREWEIIVSEKDKNVQQADTFGVSRTAYVNAYNDLLAFLGTNLNDLTTTWDLGTDGGVTLRSKFKGYYDARTDLLNGVALKAKQAADAAQNAVNTVQQGALMKNSATQQVVNSPVQFVGQIQINGDIIQNGASYETHAQHVYTSDDFIILRDGAVSNLAAGSFTGFRSKRVFGDGTDGYLVFGSDGMARVGKQGSLQMLATREDTPTDGSIQYWSATEKQMKSGVLASSLFHSGNANLQTVDWNARTLNVKQSADATKVINITPNGGGSAWYAKLDTVTAGNNLLIGSDKYIRINKTTGRIYTVDGVNEVWDAGNSNLNTVAWSCSTLTASSAVINGTITGMSAIISNSGLTDANSTITGNLPVGMRFDRGNAGFLNTPTPINNANGLLTLTSHPFGAVGTYGKQLFFTDNEELYIRRFSNGTALPWLKLFHSGNANLPTVDWTVKNLISASVVKSSNQNGSGFTAAGWQIGDYSNLNNLDVRSQLKVYEFVQNKINISNGNLIVTDSAKCDIVLDLRPTYNTIRFKFTEAHPFNVGDVVRCKSGGKNYAAYINWISPDRLIAETYGSVSLGGQSLDEIKNAGVADGDLLVRWNSSDSNRKGLLYLNSSDTNAPNFQVLYDGQIKGCFGNCAGLTWQGAALPTNTWAVWVKGGYFDEVNVRGSITVTGGNAETVTGSQAKADAALSAANYQLTLLNNSLGSLAYKSAVSTAMLDSTVIVGGYIKTSLLDVSSIIVSGGIAKTTDLSTAIGNKFTYINGTGVYTGIVSANQMTTGSLIVGTGGVGDLKVKSGATTIAQFGATNVISGWTAESFRLYSGYISLNANGSIEHTGGKWALNNDGSGKLAGGGITWDSAGNVTYSEAAKMLWRNDITNNIIGNKLTNITSSGVYTGIVKANQFIGDEFAGKTYRAQDSVGNTNLLIDGKTGAMSGFDSSVQVMQLNRGELTFFDADNNPKVFIRNKPISYNECAASASIYAAAPSSSTVSETTTYSGVFYIANTGQYQGSFGTTLAGTAIFNNFYGDLGGWRYYCSINLNITVNLEQSIDDGITWKVVNTNVGTAYAYATSQSTYVSVNQTKSLYINCNVTNITGRFRLAVNHYFSAMGNARSIDGVEEDMSMLDLSSVTYQASHTAVSLSKVSIGTYIGTNGLICYAGGENKEFVIFDNSTGYKFETRTTQKLSSANGIFSVIINDYGISLQVNGSESLKINSDGKISLPQVAPGSVSVYRLYVGTDGKLYKNTALGG